MILLNFSHPLTPQQLEQVAGLIRKAFFDKPEQVVGDEELRVVDVPSQVDVQQPLGPQVVRIVDSAGLSPAEWQSSLLLINLPSLNYSAGVLLAELHGRMGYMPTIVRLRPVESRTPTQFEVAEIIDLQHVRQEARRRRV